jgi:hypothetical protein
LALAKYQLVLATYPRTPYARAASIGAAQTLLDWGQRATRTGRYDEAAQHYSDLVELFPNSGQAAKVSALLLAPQQVVGRLVHDAGSSAAGVTVRLSSEWQFGGDGYTAAGTQYKAITDTAGVFTLAVVPPGRYLLDWAGPNGRYKTFIGVNGHPLEVVTVAPLHPVTLSIINIDLALPS